MSLLSVVDHDVNLARRSDCRIKSAVQRCFVHLIQNNRLMNSIADHWKGISHRPSSRQFTTGNDNARPGFRECS